MFFPIFSLVVAKLGLLKAISVKGVSLKGMVCHSTFVPNPGIVHSGFFYHPLGYWIPIPHTMVDFPHSVVVMSLLMGYTPGTKK